MGDKLRLRWVFARMAVLLFGVFWAVLGAIFAAAWLESIFGFFVSLAWTGAAGSVIALLLFAGVAWSFGNGPLKYLSETWRELRRDW